MASAQEHKQTTESMVTAWEVKGNVDYDKLVKQFGVDLIDDNLKNRFEKVTGHKLHPWLRRGIFFAHRDLHKMLDDKEKGIPIYCFTGRGSSSASGLHLGHLVPFVLTKWLQEVLECIVIIQMSDDEKYYFKDMEFDEVYKLGFEDAKDIIAFGFDPKKTFIFSNRDYRLSVPAYEVLVSDMKKRVSAREVAKIFGFGTKVQVKNEETGEMVEKYVFDESVTVGMMDWPFYQSAAAFSEAFPHIFDGKPAHCLVALGIDQTPYFRMARDLADKMKLIKPSQIISKFIDPLTGSGKMSSSTGTDATIFLTDTEEQIRKKIKKYAFSGAGGNGTKADHEKYGGNPDVDIPCKYLKYFEYDDDKLSKIYEEFKAGKMMCSETKKLLADKLIEIVKEHQEKRAKVTDEDVTEFYSYKPLL
jgi:tryptophanyl-tRNA synthetase